MKNRPLILVLALIAVIVGVGVAVAMSADEPKPPPPPAPPPATAPPVTTPPPTAPPPTTPAPPPTATAPPPNPQRDADAGSVEAAVRDLVEGAEQADGQRVCRVLGQRGGPGLAAAQRCTQAAGFPLTSLPSSDELSIQSATVKGSSATVRLVGGIRISLRKAGGRWTIEDVRVRTPPAP